MKFSFPRVILAAGILAVVLSGCAGKNDPQQTADSAETAAATETPAVTHAPAAAETPVVTEMPAPDPGILAADLTGYWEAERSAYLEITDEELILRDAQKRTMLRTPYTCSEENGKLVILPERNELALTAYDGRVFGTVAEVYLEDGILHLFYSYSYLPEQIKEYLFTPTDKGPFADIIILDDELLDELQGRWVGTDGESDVLNINGNTLEIGFEYDEGKVAMDYTCNFHVITYTYNRDYVILIHEDLAETEFYAFSGLQYKDGLLSGNIMVLDADWDTSISFKKAAG